MLKRAFHLLVGAAPVPSASQWQTRFASDADTSMVHAASMVELPDGRLRAFWFAGTREGAADVSINSAIFDPESGAWSDETVSVTREQISRGWGRHIRKRPRRPRKRPSRPRRIKQSGGMNSFRET